MDILLCDYHDDNVDDKINSRYKIQTFARFWTLFTTGFNLSVTLAADHLVNDLVGNPADYCVNNLVGITFLFLWVSG